MKRQFKMIIRAIFGARMAILCFRVLKLIKNVFEEIYLLSGYYVELVRYNRNNTNKAFILSDNYLFPCIYDKTDNTPLDAIYFYQDTWCVSKIIQNKPEHHYDIGSQVEMVGIISQLTPTTMIDIRPIELELKNLSFIKSDILSLPFADGSLQSISSICVIEHIGLGRYGDKLDPFGSEKAIQEILRILAPAGNFYISLPVDSENIIYFNAHRAFTRDYILRLFESAKLIEEKYIYDKEMVGSYDKLRGFGTGLFHFMK
jgi:SAM-dependent methyltransferase